MNMESHGDDDDDAAWGLLLICPPELSGCPISRDVSGK
jgi:hypothetical protein